MKGNYAEIFPEADVCVIGGGAAGMTAALAGGCFDCRVSAYDQEKALYHPRSKGYCLYILIKRGVTLTY